MVQSNHKKILGPKFKIIKVVRLIEILKFTVIKFSTPKKGSGKKPKKKLSFLKQKSVKNSSSKSSDSAIEADSTSTESIEKAVDSHTAAVIVQLKREGFDFEKWEKVLSREKIISYKDTFNAFDKMFKNKSY